MDDERPRDPRPRLLRLFAGAFVETVSARLRRGPLLPGWGFSFEWVVRFLRRDLAELAGWPPERARRDLDARPYPSGAASRVGREAAVLGGVDCQWFTPPRALPGAALIYLHGGSFLYGSTRSHADIIARLALASGLRTLGVNYRLAPEHPYPAALEDALSVYRALRAEGFSASRLAVAGESAGGNLAVSLLLALREAGLAQPAAAVPISAWLDLEGTSPSCRENAPFDYGVVETLRAQARLFAGGLALRDPRISPLYAPLHGLCPLLVQVGGAELLLDENRIFVSRIEEAGGEALLDVLPEMPHAAPLLAQYCATGRQAIERAGAFVREHIVRNLS